MNVNVNIKTVQGGEREQQNVNQVNTNVNIKTAQEGEREEQNVNQVKIETNCGTLNSKIIYVPKEE